MIEVSVYGYTGSGWASITEDFGSKGSFVFNSPPMTLSIDGNNSYSRMQTADLPKGLATIPPVNDEERGITSVPAQYEEIFFSNPRYMQGGDYIEYARVVISPAGSAWQAMTFTGTGGKAAVGDDGRPVAADETTPPDAGSPGGDIQSPPPPAAESSGFTSGQKFFAICVLGALGLWIGFRKPRTAAAAAPQVGGRKKRRIRW